EPRKGGTAAQMLLPGLVGTGALWRRACDDVESAYQTGEWLALAGEPGVGKLAILRAVHQRRNPARRFTVLDASDRDPRWLATAGRTLLEESGSDNTGSVVIRHVDRLDGVQLRSLAAVLQEVVNIHRGRAPWVAVTFGLAPPSKELGRLLRLFPSTVEVPPLRHHVEDIQQLVPFFIARLGYGGQMTCSPEVMQMLMRSTWPGNVEQMFQTLRQVVQHRRTGAIRLRDLPPETQSVSRRLLSPLESMERDAIAQALLDARGNKAEAAKSLGMSRATIYRKIREFGIVTPVR
ncbi:MAG: helix-turn-helix domain-containing protein, partial [Actinomycetes bacterium]